MTGTAAGGLGIVDGPGVPVALSGWPAWPERDKLAGMTATSNHGADDATEFVVLDARCIAAPPVAAVRRSHRTPRGFHRNWLPA